MRAHLIAIGLVLLGLVAVVAYRTFGLSGDASAPPSSLEADEQPEIVAKAEDLAERMENEAAEAQQETAPPPTPPSFDVVRIDASGSAVLAGRGEPGTSVRLFGNGALLGEAPIDLRGEWTMIVDTPLETGDQRLTLVTQRADGAEIASTQEVVVAVPERPGRKPLVVLGEAGAGSRILQAPDDGIAAGELVVESVDYDAAGDVRISGKAAPDALIRAYLDTKLVGEARASSKGRWTVQPEGIVPPGRYTLRVDETGGAGKVERRVELPFERASPEDLVFADGQVVVQPGNNLWRIARFLYGSGFQYSVIYGANRDAIRNPDLIYPGQVFALPNTVNDPETTPVPE